MLALPCPYCGARVEATGYLTHTGSCWGPLGKVGPRASLASMTASEIVVPQVTRSISTKVDREFNTIRRTYPDAVVSDSHRFISLTFPLPTRFNQRKTKMLIRLFKGEITELSYKEPDVYVRHEVDLRSGPSMHLDFDTEPEMQAKGWKKICKLASGWNQNSSLSDFMVMMVSFFGGLRG